MKRSLEAVDMWLAYKIGQLKILEIRLRAEQVLGERFDVRAFHDELLSGGAMPLDIVEDEMSRWVDDQERLLTRP